MERDWTNDWNNPDNPYGPGYTQPAPQQDDFGPNWNGGQAPPPPLPRYDYNGGSPPDQALTPGHGWVWEGEQSPVWDPGVQQWQRGAWQERTGEGLGYQAPAPAPAPTGGGGGGGGGSVPAMRPSGINIPPAQLPGEISALFNKVPQQTPIQAAMQEALLKFMGRAQETPNLKDSILGPQTEVYRAGQQRGMERTRKVNAERAAANGQSQSGYLDNLINQGVQQQNFNTASFNSNLLGQEMNKRREELAAGIQIAQSQGNQEAERELRARLAQVSAMMQQQGLNLQGQLGAGDLDLRRLLGMESLDQNALQILMGGL
jgi:hypothetical protein